MLMTLSSETCRGAGGGHHSILTTVEDGEMESAGDGYPRLNGGGGIPPVIFHNISYKLQTNRRQTVSTLSVINLAHPNQEKLAGYERSSINDVRVRHIFRGFGQK